MQLDVGLEAKRLQAGCEAVEGRRFMTVLNATDRGCRNTGSDRELALGDAGPVSSIPEDYAQGRGKIGL